MFLTDYFVGLMHINYAGTGIGWPDLIDVSWYASRAVGSSNLAHVLSRHAKVGAFPLCRK